LVPFGRWNSRSDVSFMLSYKERIIDVQGLLGEFEGDIE
jgi:hypothetical protein